MVLANPALANPKMHTGLALSVAPYLAGIVNGSALYVHDVDNVGTFFGGLEYQSYGELNGYDEFGNPTTNFNPIDLAFAAGAARAFGDLHFGSSLRVIHSNLGQATSTGMAIDFGGLWYKEDIDLGVGLALRNIGVQFTTYNDAGNRAPLPLDVQLGVSYRVPKAPFRLSLVAHNLNNPTLAFLDPDREQEVDLAGNPIEEEISVADQIFRHTIWGVEFLLGEHIRARFAYNHQRRREMQSQNVGGGFSGFSLGAGLKVWRLRVDYGFASFFRQGGAHQISLATNISAFTGKGDSNN